MGTDEAIYYLTNSGTEDVDDVSSKFHPLRGIQESVYEDPDVRNGAEDYNLWLAKKLYEVLAESLSDAADIDEEPAVKADFVDGEGKPRWDILSQMPNMDASRLSVEDASRRLRLRRVRMKEGDENRHAEVSLHPETNVLEGGHSSALPIVPGAGGLVSGSRLLDDKSLYTVYTSPTETDEFGGSFQGTMRLNNSSSTLAGASTGHGNGANSCTTSLGIDSKP